jgi:hypothetical protein
MFVSLEKQAGGLCIAIFGAVVALGKLFGGKLIGLVPLALCLASGVWLWMKEVIRSGREVEWHSEKERGKTVGEDIAICRTFVNISGYCKPPSRICGMDEHITRGLLEFS